MRPFTTFTDVAADEAVCRRCRRIGKKSKFYRCKTTKSGVTSWCRNCMKSYAVKHGRRLRLSAEYGITPGDFYTMAKRQGNKCRICRAEKALVVDHDHATGKIRDLLCASCNTGLGFLRDNPIIASRAASYLRRHQAVPA